MSSSGMASLFAAFGGLDHIKLVSTDIDGWYVEDVVRKMEAGEISFSGKYKEPDYEMITANNIQLQVDTTMVNSYPEVLEKYTELGIPYIVETSSKEDHPLGRVEWVKLWGIICDMEEEANAYFEEQKALSLIHISEAKEGLMNRFDFTDAQAQAIVDMRLRALTGLERERLENEYNELEARIEEYLAILSNEKILYGVIKEELLVIKAKYGDERRTFITYEEGEINLEDLIKNERSVITMTNLGSVSYTHLDVYKRQV